MIVSDLVFFDVTISEESEIIVDTPRPKGNGDS